MHRVNTGKSCHKKCLEFLHVENFNKIISVDIAEYEAAQYKEEIDHDVHTTEQA
ncbi:hypothetical protein [Lacihabitans sp. LS3-19]|uniref:hypothetical protein n=1 Tax=Lacihabitans sp. LS3-19 TaxID=2487335 RepID=UPI0020CFBCDA|nr:hypothetical protein [Lacihabitans sp. LS3-19]